MTVERISRSGRRWNVLVRLAGSVLLVFFVTGVSVWAQSPPQPQPNDLAAKVADLEARICRLEAQVHQASSGPSAPPAAWEALKYVGIAFAVSWGLATLIRAAESKESKPVDQDKANAQANEQLERLAHLTAKLLAASK